ncbi:MAG: dual specificity protein phosphatase family protein [Coleofasciculaceae cyanobacterium]
MLKNSYKFAPAQKDETIVFGASRPGYSDQEIDTWLNFMIEQNIKKVCCLLDDKQLVNYSNLLEIYQQQFGIDHVCWAPIKDFHLASLENLTQNILPFLKKADQQGQKVVVHCGGGIGRTGHILAAWLVSNSGLSNQAAIAAVKKTGRNPYEFAIAAALRGKNPFEAIKELDLLLNNVRLSKN